MTNKIDCTFALCFLNQEDEFESEVYDRLLYYNYQMDISPFIGLCFDFRLIMNDEEFSFISPDWVEENIGIRKVSEIQMGSSGAITLFFNGDKSEFDFNSYTKK